MMEIAPVIYRSSREFQVWEYFVSHSQLLIRSPKGVDYTKNIDLMFRAVGYMSLPAYFDPSAELILQEGSDLDFGLFREFGTFTYPGSRVFWIINGDRRFVVIAAICEIVETEFGINHSALRLDMK